LWEKIGDQRLGSQLERYGGEGMLGIGFNGVSAASVKPFIKFISFTSAWLIAAA
jgi:hypothetical protein